MTVLKITDNVASDSTNEILTKIGCWPEGSKFTCSSFETFFHLSFTGSTHM